MKNALIFILVATLYACSEAPKDAAEQTENTLTQAETELSQVAPVPWQEGKHYEVLDQEATENPEVKEFFSFYCPHCFSFEPFVQEMKRRFGDSIPVDKVHVDFMGFTNREIQQQVSVAMLVARNMGIQEQINQAIFNHIHMEQKALDTPAQLSQLLAANGISADAFDSAVTESEMVGLIEEHSQKFATYRPDLSSVPTFVVNGKYKVLFGANLNADELLSLIEWLAKQS
ncbi:thiol:disulfide interchange protein DsbA/DsbL [Glaciecola petra]|uniref:Thiol:disulfide interchange protein DsbA n=1 Tax=Glaciecola petra TaxID=3075602 RepID=A0ABU2ZQX0_9ALTE|nr:thiol:disulfide interchange protein DsbA/DsbL [Aestuariibacter sp. P117]MDT0595034.1 thiol:disulfide interchange protein DsbA/DsbL [Aestuariibacter sp. P117]